jgi:5-methylcytosine-specific restriction endonuclease McrA
MRSVLRVVLGVILLGVLASGRTVTVHEYTKKNGTVVREHTREIKNRDNYSLVGTVARTESGRIKRDLSARRDFMLHTYCPSTSTYALVCPGYVVDHIVPLSCGGPDKPENMQYQTTEAAKEKDKWERLQCGGQ